MDSYRRYNYRVYPTEGQRRALSRLYGACRFVYNWAIDQRRLMFTRHGRPQSAEQLSHMLTLLKQDPDHRWLTEVSSIPLQQAVRHADTAYRNFYRLYRTGKTRIVRNEQTGKRHRTGLPRYKSRRDGEQSAMFTRSAGFKVEHADGCRWMFLTLPKVGRIRLRWTRDLPSRPSGVAIMLHADGSYEASFTVLVKETVEAPEPIHEACGIDMGLESLMSVVYDDGSREKMPHPRTLKHQARKLRRLDRRLARQKRGSSNYGRTRLKRAKVYRKIQNQRRDMAYRLAFRVAGESQAVAMESLNVKALARTRMAKSLSDANWGRIIDPYTAVVPAIRSHLPADRPLVSEQPDLLPMRFQKRQETVGHARMGMFQLQGLPGSRLERRTEHSRRRGTRGVVKRPWRRRKTEAGASQSQRRRP